MTLAQQQSLTSILKPEEECFLKKKQLIQVASRSFPGMIYYPTSQTTTIGTACQRARAREVGGDVYFAVFDNGCGSYCFFPHEWYAVKKLVFRSRIRNDEALAGLLVLGIAWEIDCRSLFEIEWCTLVTLSLWFKKADMQRVGWNWDCDPYNFESQPLLFALKVK